MHAVGGRRECGRGTGRPAADAEDVGVEFWHRCSLLVARGHAPSSSVRPTTAGTRRLLPGRGAGRCQDPRAVGRDQVTPTPLLQLGERHGTGPESGVVRVGGRAIVRRVPSRFFVTNRLANPVLRTVLRTPAGRGLGRHLAVLRYRGRQSGLPHELVVQYAREGSTVWVNVGLPEQKKWWRNLRNPAPVELWLAGRHHRATAVAVRGATDREGADAGLAAYRAAMGDRAVASTDPSQAVLVRADLSGAEA